MTTREFFYKQIPHNSTVEDEDLIINIISDYTKLKCQELLEIVVDKAKIKTVGIPNGLTIKTCVVDENSILNAVNLDEFIK